MGLKEEWTWTPKQTASEELAIAVALNNALELIPESVVNGMGNCRAIIMSQSGLVRGGDAKKRVPLTVDLAKKISRYCGGADGAWDNRYAFDEDLKNRVEDMYDVSDPWVSDVVKDMRWKANLVSAEYANTRDLFYPAFQTSCNDDSSVFNNLFVVMCGTQLTKIAHHVWTRLAGNSRLLGKAFLDKSDELILAKLNGMFDNRFRITVRTYFSQRDQETNFSWSTEFTIYSNVMKTVNHVTIDGKYEDYAA